MLQTEWVLGVERGQAVETVTSDPEWVEEISWAPESTRMLRFTAVLFKLQFQIICYVMFRKLLIP